MSLRMSLIVVLVLALAGPFLARSMLTRLGPHANRDVVLVFDGSYSMGSIDENGTPHEKAKEWARAFVADLTPGDSVAILQAKEQVVPVLAEPSHDPALVRQHIDDLPPPAGGCDWRPALQTAAAILSHSQRAEREIIILRDGQRFSWADRDSLFRWSLLSSEFQVPSSEENPNSALRIEVVNVAPRREADPPNWSLTPLQTNRLLAPAGREITFRTAMDLHGQKTYAPPHRIRLEIDGRFVRNLEAPRAAQLRNGRAPFSFAHSFAALGSHLVSVILQADPPPEERPADYTIRDKLPGDNRQDFAIEVVRELSVLIVDGDTRGGGWRVEGGGKKRSSFSPPSTLRPPPRDFLRQALEARDPAPIVRARVAPINEFDPALLAAPEANKEGVARPRVLILRNVARLTTAQQEAITQFLADGGGVLVTLGSRVEADSYNIPLYRGGKGWLPAHLDGIEVNAAHPAPGGSDHPALRLFLEKPKDGQGPARFPQLGRVRLRRWWKLTPPGRSGWRVEGGGRREETHSSPSTLHPPLSTRNGVPVAALRSAANDYPFLVEWIDPNGAGRLLLCAVPLDDSWGTELIRDESFVPLVHELVYYLAGARAAEFNLEPGQPLRHRLDSSDDLARCKLQTPLGQTKSLSANPADNNALLAAVDRLPQGVMLRIEGMRETGIYRLHTAEDGTIYYVVRPKRTEESDLTPCSDEDRAQVAEILPNLKYHNDREQMTQEWISENHRQELWWWLLSGLIALLCGEVWLTRRIVKNR